MKKFIFTMVLAGVLVSNVAFGAATSTPSEGGDPRSIVQVWGLTGFQTKTVPCLMFGWLKSTCYDISGTEFYRAMLRKVGLLR